MGCCPSFKNARSAMIAKQKNTRTLSFIHPRIGATYPSIRRKAGGQIYIPSPDCSLSILITWHIV
jgi:hypothetical protein